MKKKMFSLLAVVCAVSMFTACSSSDDIKDEYQTLDGDYKGESLTLNYGETLLPGKTVSFEARKGDNATITLDHVIPGEETTQLKVKLEAVNRAEDKYFFEGKDEVKNGRIIEYKGAIAKDNMALTVNVTMPESDLMGTWNLDEENPVHLVWEMKDETKNEEIQGLIEMLSPALSMIHSVLESVTFGKDGDIRAMYSEIGQTEFQESPANYAHYYEKDSKLYVILNVKAITEDLTRAAAKENQGIIESMILNGFPVNYELKDGELKVFIDKSFITTIFSDEALQKEIKKIIDELEDEEDKEDAMALIEGLQELMDDTTKLEFGLNMVAASEEE